MKQQIQILEHSPTLKTIQMVEKTLTNMDESLITIAELKRRLPKQINHNTLKTILEYLQQSGKIMITVRGIIWTYNDNPNFEKLLAESTPYDTLRRKAIAAGILDVRPTSRKIRTPKARMHAH
ncbi:MAG: hypothetical protein Q7R96_02840 [Nanoarchaeota archaeon]|nr:hypothetical protein [Nanoarchaeota archaeon]